MSIAMLLLTHSPPYSYGDSAGFAPDFPFNDAVASTKYAAKMVVANGKNKKGMRCRVEGIGCKVEGVGYKVEGKELNS